MEFCIVELLPDSGLYDGINAGYWWISQYNFIPRNTCTASCLILFARNIQFYRNGHMPCLVWRIFLCMLKGGSCVYSITVLQFYSAHGCSRRVVLWNMLLVNNIEVSIHSAEEFCEQFSHLCERESKFFVQDQANRPGCSPYYAVPPS